MLQLAESVQDRIEAIETSVSKLGDLNEIERGRLKNKIDALQVQLDQGFNRFWVILMIALLSSGLTATAAYVFLRTRVRAYADKQLQLVLDDYVKSKLAGDIEAGMRRKIGGLLRDQKDILVDIISATSQVEEFKEKSKILAICDDGAAAEFMDHLLKNLLEFQGARSVIFGRQGDLDEYDLVICCKPPGLRPSSNENLDPENFMEFMKGTDCKVMFFGGKLTKTIMENPRTSAANKPATLYPRMIEMLQFDQIEKEYARGKA